MEMDRLDVLFEVLASFRTALKNAQVNSTLEMGMLLGTILDIWQEENGISLEETNDMLYALIESRKEVNNKIGRWVVD